MSPIIAGLIASCCAGMATFVGSLPYEHVFKGFEGGDGQNNDGIGLA